MKRISFYILLILLVSACDEIFEQDITNAKIEIMAPRDSLVTTKTTLTFWWNELTDANSYRLQIVSTSFDTILSLPVDTTLTTNKFEVSLNPGRYGWRVKALNSATETAWFTQKLTILDVPDLTDQEVILNTPDDQDAYNTGKVRFRWTKLHNATRYNIVVKRNSWIGDPVFSSETIYDTITKVFTEGKYAWGVTGINDYSSSKPKNKIFYIDFTAPDKPTLQDPADNSTITGTSTTLQWTHPTVDLTPVYDSVYIAKDNTFSSTSILEKAKVTTTSFSFSNTTHKGKVYWRVKTIDKVGNKSPFSTPFSFTLQ